MNKIDLSGYEIETITLNNLSKYEDVFYCNTDYYMITDGHPATKKDCIETVEYCIDDMPNSKIHNIGFSENGHGVACLFLIEKYPNDNTLWLGLFLVHNQYKRKHIGSEIIKALLHSLKDTTMKHIRLSVQNNNIVGLSFWKHLGFSVVDSTHCDSFVNLTMEYTL